tara:strand:- start:715 stop:1047 length:333 start_codon:yes stop_codon:yes gene_type:complete
MTDDGPPTDGHTPTSSKGRQRGYPETPMPYDGDDDTDSEIDVAEATKGSFFNNAFAVLAAAVMVAHLWTVWTLRADINIVLAYQEENSQQYKYIIDLLQNMKPQYQIVPA